MKEMEQVPSLFIENGEITMKKEKQNIYVLSDNRF